VNLILAFQVGGRSLLSVDLLTRVRRIPSALALHGGLLQSITVWTWLSEQDVDLFKSATGGLWAVVPHVSGSEETADQRPNEDLGADSGDASATTKDHDPGGEPLACGAKTAGNVTVAERGDLRTC